MTHRKSAKRPPVRTDGPPRGSARRSRVRAWAVALGLLAATFLYLSIVVEPPLRYESAAPVFYLEGPFFWHAVTHPGGLLEYAAGGVAQADCDRWLGAALGTVVVGLIVLLGPRLASGRGEWVVGSLPGFIFLALLGRYDAPALEVGMGGLLVLAAVLVWRAGPRRVTGFRMAIFWGLAAGVFYSGGWLPALVFALLGGGLEVIRERRIRPALGCWLAGLFVVMASVWGYGSNPSNMLERWGSGWSLGLTVAFYLGLAVAGLARAWLTEWGRSESGTPEPPWMAALLCTLGAMLLIVSFDGRQKALLRIQCAANEGRWDEVLAVAAGLADVPAGARLRVERALYHRGRLCDDLFSFPRTQGADLLLNLQDGLDICLPMSDTLLEMGHVNLAERYAHEALEIQGERPEVLRRLALIQVIQGRPQAACIFLRRLALMPFHRKRAESQLRAIRADPVLTSDAALNQVRAVAVKTELEGTEFSAPVILGQAVASSPSNRMAFEYSVAQLLVTSQLEEVVRNLAQFRARGFRELPRHVEEALMLALARRRTSDPALDLHGYRVRPVTADRFKRYVELGQRTGVAEALLEPEFGDTFWFYSQFGRCYGRR